MRRRIATFLLAAPVLLGPSLTSGTEERLRAGLAALEHETQRRVDEARRERGLPPLAAVPALAEVAQEHSRDMAKRGAVDHLSSEGSGPADRVRTRGISFVVVAENVAMTKGDPDPVRAVVEGWIASPGHRENMMDPRVTQTGVGIAVSADGAYWFTQIFLRPPAVP